jgi:iron complex outermembrane receptor protein
LDRFGQPITGNIEKTIHTGIEIEGSAKIVKAIDFIFNASYSKNYVEQGLAFINTVDIAGNDVVNEINLAENLIGGFPELTMNAIIKINYKGFFGQLSGKYVGDYYSDNYDNKLTELLTSNPDFVGYTDNTVDSYFVMNILGSYEFRINSFLTTLRIIGQVNNVFDNLYAAYATGGDFFPAAERNFLVGVKLGL